MTDVIPGATYYDSVFELEAICNGTTMDDGTRQVVLEYEGVSDPMMIPIDIFQEDRSFEIDEDSIP